MPNSCIMHSRHLFYYSTHCKCSLFYVRTSFLSDRTFAIWIFVQAQFRMAHCLRKYHSNWIICKFLSIQINVHYHSSYIWETNIKKNPKLRKKTWLYEEFFYLKLKPKSNKEIKCISLFIINLHTLYYSLLLFYKNIFFLSE